VPTANTFTEGVTHVTHFLQLSGSTIDINLTDVPGAPAGYVDGFQVIFFPEPTAATAALLASIPVLARRRPRRHS